MHNLEKDLRNKFNQRLHDIKLQRQLKANVLQSAPETIPENDMEQETSIKLETDREQETSVKLETDRPFMNTSLNEDLKIEKSEEK